MDNEGVGGRATLKFKNQIKRAVEQGISCQPVNSFTGKGNKVTCSYLEQAVIKRDYQF
jgi:hypothetical protein